MNHPSASGHDTPAGHGDDALHVHQGSLRGYLTGFVLAAILTVIPFWLVMGHVLSSPWLTISIVLLFAIAQILVHIIYFLHLDVHSEDGWNMLAFIFTIVLVVIVLGASIWVMYNENTNMMPMSPQYHHHTE
ncbi:MULTISPECIES: cytochrome o ubiquinol oxidase subunit IV [Rhodanobacter]|jgi:cytochrome o ubiquinol oxidase operon protein cyoD|uniref:Cytochrome bo(3) ubiquinol oxidase subunit 4 n=2 Tax=Bacteria TaxID=2 RepID=A0A1I4D6M7_9GAMM|nr:MULTISPECIES: cytochrome o ubiquinol oxidase subunit IV [Rhodanobacter]EIL87391.1 cytochrome o ubiquinol oxidase subunit IV [Rhodanobacter sp. 115]QEE23674.1 cytochrome o ubiquinol oxidase subunit IV [Rhodanobacter glycinis]TAM19116.1 MAG: cytochrome o ubiquinol oxidase subunit IV [Rhodanobacter sp.]SFK87806.1 cytochrome bo3 quinol oxidase subunit 4 [Rhodanobacter glycinis]